MHSPKQMEKRRASTALVLLEVAQEGVQAVQLLAQMQLEEQPLGAR